MKQRPEDQPLPRVNDRPIIQDLVIADIRERLALGIKRYGTGLQAFNGRDMLRDAYEEALDLAVYLRGCIEERRYREDTMEGAMREFVSDARALVEVLRPDVEAELHREHAEALIEAQSRHPSSRDRTS